MPQLEMVVRGALVNPTINKSLERYKEDNWDNQGAKAVSERTLLNLRRYVALEMGSHGYPPDWTRINPDGSVEMQWTIESGKNKILYWILEKTVRTKYVPIVPKAKLEIVR